MRPMQLRGSPVSVSRRPFVRRKSRLFQTRYDFDGVARFDGLYPRPRKQQLIYACKVDHGFDSAQQRIRKEARLKPLSS